MRIKYNEFAPNPTLRNTIAHFPAHIAQNLIAQGIAVAVPYKNYGERLSEEFAQGSDPSNVNAFAPVAEWGVREAANSRFSKAVIIKRFRGEITYFEQPPSDAPPDIVARFNVATRTIKRPDLEKARQEQHAQQEQEKAGFYGVLYGSRK